MSDGHGPEWYEGRLALVQEARQKVTEHGQRISDLQARINALNKEAEEYRRFIETYERLHAEIATQ